MSFINFNNRSELYEGKYSARVIAEALYSIETKNTKKIEATLSSVKEPVAISEALKFFSNKINALSALHVAKTNALPVNEGQFSWMTQDTGEQIGSEKENRITVYMYDNEGNQYKEDKYDGYGEFGGMDYYELLAKMNGYSEEDLEEVKGPFKEMRQLGIDLAFGKLKTKDKGGKVLFPVLVEDPKFLWKRHNFTQEPESDPNQSWYVEPEYDAYESRVSEGAMSVVNESQGNDVLASVKAIRDFNRSSRGAGDINQLAVDIIKNLGFRAVDPNVTNTIEHLANSTDSNEKIPEDKTLVRELYSILESRVTKEAKIVISKADMSKLHKEGNVEINGNVIEFVEEGLSWDSLIGKINEEDLNERSINKIQKDWTKVTADMKDAVTAWKSAEGSEKEKKLAKLKELTAKKKSLEAELDNVVGLKDVDAEFVGEARDPKSIQKEYADLKKLSKKELQAMWSRSNKVGNPKELDKEGLISDILRSKHGNTYVDVAFESVSLSEFVNESSIDESVNEIKKGSVVIPYAMDKDGEFIVDKVFKNKSGETSYTGKFKKSGESREFILHSKDKVVKESVVTEAKTLKRDDIIAWIENYIEVVRTSEEFDGAHGGIWVSGENGDLYKQMPIYDYYNEGSRNYSLGVLIAWEKELNKRGWYSEWYDAGTVMIWPN